MRISDWSSDVCSSDLSTGLTGKPRKGTHMLCVNPLTGAPDTKAVASQNLGTLKPNEDMSDAELIQAAVPARCDERGFLLIGNPPELGPYVLPGNNYTVYDYRDRKSTRLNSSH